ncbi:MAG: Smr/MutS family protein [Desulfobacterales bacterium]
MKSSNPHGNFRPFKDLQALLEEKAVELKPNLEASKAVKTDGFDATTVDQRSDRLIFQEAMTGVKKISKSNCAVPSPTPHSFRKPVKKVDENGIESLVKLKELILKGTGFVVSLTPEYVEGMAPNVSPEVARRLHRGYFSIQAHIDLHGLGVNDARQAINRFLNKSILEGKRAVLVIHGRGLSSPYQPVLKTKVYQWLTAAPWHKWVIAFTSARMCDGGAGATYILLRKQPLTKRYRKKNKVRS